MKTLITNILVIFLLVSVFCTASIAKNAKSGKDIEVVNASSTIVDLIKTGNFQDLKKLIDGIFAAKALTVDGRRQLEELYMELRKIDAALLDKWVTGSLDSAHPYVVRGKFNLLQAQRLMEERGIYSFVQPDREVKLLLRKAQADLEKASKLNPVNPAAPAELVVIAMYRGYPDYLMNQWFAKAIESDPFWLAAYRYKLQYLSPYQHGSVKKMLNFAVQCSQNYPKGSSVYSVLLDYFSMLNGSVVQVTSTSLGMLNLPSEAHRAFLRVIDTFKEDFPHSYEPFYYEALYKALQGEPQAAEYMFNTILKEEPRNQKVLKARINLYMVNGKWVKAKKDCEMLLMLSPESPLALSNLGALASLISDDIEKTADLYQKAISNEPSPYKKKYFYLDFANFLAKKHSYEKAIAAFSSALKLDPIFDKALLGRAESSFHSGDLKGAEDDLIHLIEFNGRLKMIARDRLEEYRKQSELVDHKLQIRQQPVNKGAAGKKSIRTADIRTADLNTPAPTSVKTKQMIASVDQLMLKCEGFYYRKMLQESIECYSDILVRVPEEKQGQSYFMLGKIAESIEYDLPKAIGYYKRAILRSPGNEDYILKLGELLYMRQEFDQAIMVFSKLLEMNQQNGRAFYLRGLCFEGKGLREKAIKDMQQARLYDPANVDVERFLQQYAVQQPPAYQMSEEQKLLNLAENNMQLNRYDEAEKQFLELINKNVDQDYAHFRLGILYIERDRNHKKAIEQFTKAIELKNDSADYYFNRAIALQFIGKTEKAIDDFSSYITLRPTKASVYENRGSCYFNIGKFKKAANDFQMALKYSPGNKMYMHKLSEASVKTGSDMGLGSNDVNFLIERGKTYCSSSDFENAKKDYLRAMELAPSEGEPCYLLGRLYKEKLKDKQKALLFFTKAIDRDKSKRDYFFHRGLVLYGLKKWQDASVDFTAAIELSPKDGQIMYYRGNCYRKLGMKEQAIDDYLNVKKYSPSWTQSVNRHLEEMM